MYIITFSLDFEKLILNLRNKANGSTNTLNGFKYDQSQGRKQEKKFCFPKKWFRFRVNIKTFFYFSGKKAKPQKSPNDGRSINRFGGQYFFLNRNRLIGNSNLHERNILYFFMKVYLCSSMQKSMRLFFWKVRKSCQKDLTVLL